MKYFKKDQTGEGILGSGSNVEVTRYTGDGTTERTFTFPKPPKMVIIGGMQGSVMVHAICIHGWGNMLGGADASASLNNYLNWEENTMTVTDYPTGGSATTMFNVSGTEYPMVIFY